jgi:pyridoxamine 5'-phosphate oxidase
LPSPGQQIADIRREYRMAALDEDTAGADPFGLFGRWFAEAESAQIPDVNAMTLATVDEQGFPHARIVLLKGLEEGGFIFYTNYESAKGRQLMARPEAALVFFWKELERQVRIEGSVTTVPAAESDRYFSTRPAGSRLGAWASEQSRVVASRDELEHAFSKYEHQFSGTDIPRPPHWGGFCVHPRSIEFWQGRSSRLHDRILFTRNPDGWVRSRLAP